MTTVLSQRLSLLMIRSCNCFCFLTTRPVMHRSVGLAGATWISRHTLYIYYMNLACPGEDMGGPS